VYIGDNEMQRQILKQVLKEKPEIKVEVKKVYVEREFEIVNSRAD